MEQEINLKFDFVMPADPVLRTAIKAAGSQDENLRAVGKAMLDVTREAKSIQEALVAGRPVELSPYFDFWFGDAVAAANVVLKSDDESSRALARCLIEQEQAIIKSRKGFLDEAKRLGVKRKL